MQFLCLYDQNRYFGGITMKRLMILPLLLVVLVSFSANAAGPGKKDWHWWDNAEIAEKLSLSADQQTQLKDIAAKFDPIYTEAKTNYTEKKTAYIQAKTNKETSSADIIKAFDTSWDSKYKMKRVKLDSYLEMRDVLTQEQLTALSDIMQAHKDKMMKEHHEMKDKKDHHKEQMKEQQN